MLRFQLLSLLVWYSLLSCPSNSSCSFSAGSYSIDLSSIASYEISDDYQGFTYDLKLCSNTLDCTGGTGTHTGTATQSKSGNCNLLGKYDSSTTADYDKSSDTWQLQFKHGTRYKCNNNISRALDLYLHCNESQSLKSTTITNPSSCVYSWNIETQYACNTKYNPLNAISVGTIILIIFISCLFLYCIIGYIINCRKKSDGDWKQCKSNIPQFNFWFFLLPKLTWTGCIVTKDFIYAKYQQYKGKMPENEFEAINEKENE